MRGVSWLAAKTVQLLKRYSAPWSKDIVTKALKEMTNVTNFMLCRGVERRLRYPK
jgi:hypothetical protein